MRWLDRVERRATAPGEVARRSRGKSFVMPPFWSMDGARVSLMASSYMPDREMVSDDFESHVSDLYKANGIVFACIAARARVFGQARFLFQKLRNGRPTDFFSTPDLGLLERPWSRGTTGEMLTSMEVDASLAGNAFSTLVDKTGRIGRAARPDDGLFISRMRPDWCTLVVSAPSGNPFNVDARVVALSYAPPGMRQDPLILNDGEFMHYSPLPDPLARFRGMSWLTPIIRDVQADKAYTDHKLAFLRNGATPNLVIKMGDEIEDEDFQAFVAQFRRDYEGAANAYRTLFLAGGADVTPLSADFTQLDLRGTQGALETRIAAAAGVHPSIAGLSEGLAGSSLNAGNFSAARRLMVDSTIRDLWSKAAASLEVHVPAPDSGSRLWYDSRDIPFLREDAGDEAQTFLAQVQAARHAADGGWEPDACIAAAKASDISLLMGKHTGMLSVQLQTPGQETPAVDGPPTLDIQSNGNGGRPLATVGG